MDREVGVFNLAPLLSPFESRGWSSFLLLLASGCLRTLYSYLNLSQIFENNFSINFFSVQKFCVCHLILLGPDSSIIL